MGRKKSLTLIELLIAILLMVGVLLGISAFAIFSTRQITSDLERYNIYSQMTLALEDMKVRCISAISTTTPFQSGGGQKNEFAFQGEENIYDITPDDTSDNADYRYAIDENGNLVITNETDHKTDVLVESRFAPHLTFTYTAGDVPNFLTVTISAQGKKDSSLELSMTDAIRFWFLDVVQ
jgi:type II secretory pathway component PulJ